MSKFFVGQRVRVNCQLSRQHGTETTIRGFCKYLDGGPGIEVDILNSQKPPGRPFCVFESHELEPILDQKHEACDEDFKRDLDRLLERQGVVA